tara:strand:- start:884 stop:1348 length:465 start_codon:yes stop_codon:yes gene_type:complete
MIVLDKLQKQYGRQKILQKITHTFASNSKTVILGSNGSGKSTLIKILSGALEASDNPPVFTINAKEIAAKEIGLYLTIAAPYVALKSVIHTKRNLALSRNYVWIPPRSSFRGMGFTSRSFKARRQAIGHLQLGNVTTCQVTARYSKQSFDTSTR